MLSHTRQKPASQSLRTPFRQSGSTLPVLPSFRVIPIRLRLQISPIDSDEPGLAEPRFSEHAVLSTFPPVPATFPSNLSWMGSAMRLARYFPTVVVGLASVAGQEKRQCRNFAVLGTAFLRPFWPRSERLRRATTSPMKRCSPPDTSIRVPDPTHIRNLNNLNRKLSRVRIRRQKTIRGRCIAARS